MTPASQQLRAAMLQRLRSSESFAAGVRGRILTDEPLEFPSAWIGISENAEKDSAGQSETIATLHIWKRSGNAAAASLIGQARLVFQEPLQVPCLNVTSFAEEFSEVRLHDEQGAYRGLIRFRIRHSDDLAIRQEESAELSPAVDAM